MWEQLPLDQRKDYQKMICFFSSLTPLFSQKSDGLTICTPYINSKYQEKVFQISFNSTVEDVGNTSYDASLTVVEPSGQRLHFLVGIKSFIYNKSANNGGGQKIAQFKGCVQNWANMFAAIKKTGTRQEINEANKIVYKKLAEEIATIRNARISSSEANLKGFSMSALDDKDSVEAVYHVLMPSLEDGVVPVIYVGELSYKPIDINNIKILGCTSPKTPLNFEFEDGIHTYKFTAADCQLYMRFEGVNLIRDKWEVTYLEDAYGAFSKWANESSGTSTNSTNNLLENLSVTAPQVRITSSFSWPIFNNKGIVERYSGFNAFNALGSKLQKKGREQAIQKLVAKFFITKNDVIEYEIINLLKSYLLEENIDKPQKEGIRDLIVEKLSQAKPEMKQEVEKLLYRPNSELYIPIPKSKKFHSENPDFFTRGAGTMLPNSSSLALSKEDRAFELVFEPSGKKIRSYITQDAGKAIESCEKQTILGDWILRQVFQLKEHEPLTAEKLEEIGLNGIRLFRTNMDNDVHLQFIYIDSQNPPKDIFN